MKDDRTSGRTRRWIAFVSAITAVVLGVVAAVALAQDGTSTAGTTETTEETTPQTTSTEPDIPSGFDRDDCEFTENSDGSTTVVCSRAGETETSTSESIEGSVTTDVTPIGGTAAGAGGTATKEDLTIPFALGAGGLLLALMAGVLIRRSRPE